MPQGVIKKLVTDKGFGFIAGDSGELFFHHSAVEDANFDLEYHVRHIALPKPGDWRQLCEQAARIHSRILDLTTRVCDQQASIRAFFCRLVASGHSSEHLKTLLN